MGMIEYSENLKRKKMMGLSILPNTMIQKGIDKGYD